MVSDVHFEAQFLIRLLKPSSENDLSAIEEKNIISSCQTIQNHSEESSSERMSESPNLRPNLRNGNEEKLDFLAELDLNGTQNSRTPKTDINESNDIGGSSDLDILQNHFRKQSDSNLVSAPYTVKSTLEPSFDRVEAPLITAIIAKLGFTCSLTHLRTSHKQSEIPDFDKLLSSQIGQDLIVNGFTVKKSQKKQFNGSKEYQMYEEFEIVIPPGSALLFPTKKSISLEAVNFDVKHLVVLDGTWKKAKRMYHENPWLKLLPHIKLAPSQVSLYKEVRHEPKIGFLSTIESIIFVLKELGDNHEGLDDLLNVFESMIFDQRRCKDERLSKASPV